MIISAHHLIIIKVTNIRDKIPLLYIHSLCLFYQLTIQWVDNQL